MLNNLLFNNYYATVCEITMQASSEILEHNYDNFSKFYNYLEEFYMYKF